MSQNKKSHKSQTKKEKAESEIIDDCLETENIENIFTSKDPTIKDVLIILREIMNSVQFMSAKYDVLVTRNLELENLCDKLKLDNKRNLEEIKELKQNIKKNGKTFSEKKLEIHGIPYNQNEDLEDIIVKIGVNFDLNLKKEDIDEAFRIQKNKNYKSSNNNDTPVMVTFLRKKDRESFLSMRRRRSIFTDEVNIHGKRSQIFINEHLTKESKELLWKAKKIKTEKNFKFLWIKNGNILLRKTENSEVIKINAEEDLEKLS